MFGLPRDLNVDRALLQQGHVRRGRHRLSGRHLDLGQARRGRQAADQGHQRRRHRSTSGASTPRRPTWRTAWSSFVWQAGGDILTEDGTKSALDKPESAAGIQFLQDLIWKDKVVPDPAIFAETGDAFEQGWRRWRSTAPGWSRPTRRPGINLGIAPLPAGPAGKATSVNPTGAVVYAGTKAPEASWVLAKYLASPEAQAKIMALKASVPVNKEILADHLSRPRSTAPRCSRTRSRSPTSSRRSRATTSSTRSSRPSSTRTSSTPPTRRAARDRVGERRS